MMHARPYERKDYAKVMAFLSQLYQRNGNQHSWLPARWEYAEYLVHPLFTGRGFADWISTIRLWEDEGELVGVMNSENPDDNAFLQIHPDYRFLEEEMIGWAEEHIAQPLEGTTTKRCFIWAHDGDTVRTELLARLGYRPWDECEYLKWQPLDTPVPPVTLPDGYTLRSLAEGFDIPSRNACAALAFNDPDPLSLEVYQVMQSAPSYRLDLDLVTQDATGTVTSFCTVWFDEENRIGVFEPVGTHPAHQRKGLGRAMLFAGLTRLQQLGARTAYVGAYGEGRSYFYGSAGFTYADAYRQWVKEF